MYIIAWKEYARKIFRLSQILKKGIVMGFCSNCLRSKIFLKFQKKHLLDSVCIPKLNGLVFRFILAKDNGGRVFFS